MNELRKQYRQLVFFKGTDLSTQEVAQKVMSAIIPHKIDRDHDQTIREISIEDCNLNDNGV